MFGSGLFGSGLYESMPSLISNSFFDFIFCLFQVKIVRLEFLSKDGCHPCLLVLRNFTRFPVHSVGHVEKSGTGGNFPVQGTKDTSDQ